MRSHLSWTLCVIAGCSAVGVVSGEPDTGGNEPDDATRFTDPVVSEAPPGDCGLEAPAFCETFEAAHPGGRGGNLDESLWSFARWGHIVQYLWERIPAKTYADRLFPATFCGEPFSDLGPGDDVAVCPGEGVGGVVSGQLNEVFDDTGDFGFNSMRIRQPFDFTDRTGTVVWDVDAKINPYNMGHGWWFEMWITADPAPMPYHDAPTVAALPREGVGFAFRFGADCDIQSAPTTEWLNALETVVVTHDHQILHWYPFYTLEASGEGQRPDCFRVADQKLNHFELRLSQSRAELWASDYDNPESFRLRSVVNNLDLSFSRGYVHFQHAHYNGVKDGVPSLFSRDGCVPSGAESCTYYTMADCNPDGTHPCSYNAGCFDPDGDGPLESDPTLCPTPSQTFRWDNIGFDGPAYPTPRAYDMGLPTEPGTGDGVRIGWFLSGGETRAFTLHDVDLTDALGATLNADVMLEEGQELEYRLNGGALHTFVVPVREGTNPGTSFRAHTIDLSLDELVTGDNTIEVHVPDPFYSEGIGNVDVTVVAP